MPKWMKLLLGLLAALLAAYFLMHVPMSSRRTEAPAVPSEASRLKISRPGLEVVLEKTDGAWRLRQPLDAAADEGAVHSLLAGLKTITLEETLTRRAETYGRYQVDDSSGIRVTADGKGERAEWIFGKAAPDMGHIYLRLPGQPDVFLAAGPRREDLERSLAQWRDRRVLDLAPAEDIVQAEARLGKKRFALARSSDSWTMDGKAADPERADRFIAALRELSADGFIDPPESEDLRKWGLDAPQAVYRIKTAAGRVLELKAGKPDAAGRVPLRRDGQTSLFWVPDYRWEELASLKDIAS